MKRFALMICSVAFLFAACNNEKTSDSKTTNTDTSGKTEDKKSKTYTMPDSATAMKNMMAYATPGPEHAMMAKWDGTWSGDVTFYEPGKPEQKSTSTTVNKMIMNGLYQESKHSGDMMGMPFSGLSTMGYDNHKKMFVNTWIDNFGSGVMYMEGPWDEATKTITLKGTAYNSGAGVDCDFRQTYKIVDDNNHEMEMFGTAPDGSEMKMMVIKFTRKK